MNSRDSMQKTTNPEGTIPHLVRSAPEPLRPTIMPTSPPQQRDRHQAGFTLLELVITIGIFGMVMSIAYQILSSTIAAEERITKDNRSGKIGQGILQQIRRDLQGAVWRGCGPNVFVGIDNGSGDDATDEIHFLTTAPVPRPEDEDEFIASEVASVGYVMKQGDDGYNILFRRVKTDLGDNPLEDGEYYEIYSLVRGLEFHYLDREEEWKDDWESAPRLEELENENLNTFLPFYDEQEARAEQDALDAAESADPDALLNDEDEEEEEEIPLPIPRAVEIILHLGIGDERGLYMNEDDEPILERVSTIVPIICSEVLRVEDPEDTDDEDATP